MYIESHQELGRHPKTARLARSLGVSKVTAIGHLQYFWWWCMDYAPDGELSKYTTAEIADGAMWEGDPDTFMEAMQEARFIDYFGEGEGCAVHDWDQYGGKLIARRKADAERKSAERAGTRISRPTDVQRTSGGGPRDGVRRVEKSRVEENPPHSPPAGGEVCGEEISESHFGADEVIGLPSACLSFKAHYPPTMHPTSDRELLIAWNSVCKNGEDERKIARGFKAWKRSEQWANPQMVPSMKNFLLGRKFDAPPDVPPPQQPERELTFEEKYPQLAAGRERERLIIEAGKTGNWEEVHRRYGGPTAH